MKELVLANKGKIRQSLFTMKNSLQFDEHFLCFPPRLNLNFRNSLFFSDFIHKTKTEQLEGKQSHATFLLTRALDAKAEAELLAREAELESKRSSQLFHTPGFPQCSNPTAALYIRESERLVN